MKNTPMMSFDGHVISGNNNVVANANGAAGQLQGDTILTKLFVGGLAWETPKESLRQHFEKYGQIVEAVVISDKLTGRSKGYGFVTFNQPEAANKACNDPSPIIDGRRANCNLAALGVRRHNYKQSPTNTNTSTNTNTNTKPPHHHQHHQVVPSVVKHVPIRMTAGTSPPPPPQAPLMHYWYYPAAGTLLQAQPLLSHQNQPTAVSFYGYSPAYITVDHYSHKLNYGGGAYMNGHYQMYNTSAPPSAHPNFYSGAGHHQHHHLLINPNQYQYQYNNNSMTMFSPTTTILSANSITSSSSPINAATVMVSATKLPTNSQVAAPVTPSVPAA